MAGTVAALGGLLGHGILDLGGEGDVVVNVLAPGNQEKGDGVVVLLVAGVAVGGDEPG